MERLKGSRLGTHWDILVERVSVWFLARLGDLEPSPESHQHLAERYGWLAEHHRRKGETEASERSSVRAAYHARQGGTLDTPPAVAVSMPIPTAAPGPWPAQRSPSLGDGGDPT